MHDCGAKPTTATVHVTEAEVAGTGLGDVFGSRRPCPSPERCMPVVDGPLLQAKLGQFSMLCFPRQFAQAWANVHALRLHPPLL